MYTCVVALSHLQVSDDEDDTHPNIDTPSLFRWRHQARVERMEKQKEERDSFEKESGLYVPTSFFLPPFRGPAGLFAAARCVSLAVSRARPVGLPF